MELEENQMKRFRWEQDQISHMKVHVNSLNSSLVNQPQHNTHSPTHYTRVSTLVTPTIKRAIFPTAVIVLTNGVVGFPGPASLFFLSRSHLQAAYVHV